MKSITIVIFNLDFGGSEQVIVNLANKLSENYSVRIVTVNNITSEYFNLNNSIELITFSKSSFFEGVPSILKYCFSTKDDILISNDMPLNLVCSFAFKIFFKKNIKHILIEHSMPPIKNTFSWPIVKWIYSSADEIISVANSIKDCLKEKFRIEKHINTINNPIFSDTHKKTLNLSPFQQSQISKWKSANAIKILNVANLKPVKDHATLINSVKILKSKGQNISLLIIGDGFLKKSLEELIKVNNLEENIFLLGQYPASNKFFLMSDLFVLSSISEGFSLALCQAAQNDLKIVSTFGAKTSELLGDDYPYISKVADPHDLANKIMGAILNPKIQINEEAILNSREEVFYKKYLRLIE